MTSVLSTKPCWQLPNALRTWLKLSFGPEDLPCIRHTTAHGQGLVRLLLSSTHRPQLPHSLGCKCTGLFSVPPTCLDCVLGPFWVLFPDWNFLPLGFCLGDSCHSATCPLSKQLPSWLAHTPCIFQCMFATCSYWAHECPHHDAH